MNRSTETTFRHSMPDENQVLKLRPAKEKLDPFRPYLFLNEEEPGFDGELHKVNTIFLTNRECPFKCVMCDLWKHTLDEVVPIGAIPEQIRYALVHLPEATVIKLYNNGNFFDRKAIPVEDYPDICKLISSYDSVIVENHPKLCSNDIIDFQKMLNGSLEIALGLETIHPDVLPRLNKQINTDIFKEAVHFLKSNNIKTRAFILLNPPFLTDRKENIYWCLKSVEFAFQAGIDTCSIIPTRAGNGIMDQLQKDGDFSLPQLTDFEEVIDKAFQTKSGRIFADTWNLKPFSDCNECLHQRTERLNQMNLQQCILPRINCHCNAE
jgi:archaeosine synthase beta-subunit